uniref:Transmembrane protein n=1 Tax=Schistosoma japonicum TaxID=6182 RepID=C1LNV7_SCHJA|nr:hypothetical protein [Schistosoma japonicum]CAX76387.1 hypothetical protein [Schistosoma japonicum]CAX76388.1 hypothetical protein [Schistosoma japonicum]
MMKVALCNLPMLLLLLLLLLLAVTSIRPISEHEKPHSSSNQHKIVVPPVVVEPIPSVNSEIENVFNKFEARKK